MKRLFPVLLVFVLIISSVGAHAMDTEKIVGEVLYHQNFSDISDIGESGIRVGTSSSEASLVSCPGDSLEIVTYDSGRVHVLLPDADKGDENSYTLEFTFRFKDIHSTNGFIAPILTCRGNEPSNITSVTIRADGTVDEFSGLDDELIAAITGGETVGVKIPVNDGVMHEIIFTSGGKEYTAERSNVLMVASGSIGFTVRNADAEIDEVYIVNGTDYDEKSGYYADKSYANDQSAVILPENMTDGGETSPETGDNTLVLVIVACTAIVGFGVLALFGKKRR